VQQVQSLVSYAARELGPIDILVNNAGSLVKRMPIADLSKDTWDEILALNVRSAAFCTQAVAASMI